MYTHTSHSNIVKSFITVIKYNHYSKSPWNKNRRELPKALYQPAINQSLEENSIQHKHPIKNK